MSFLARSGYVATSVAASGLALALSSITVSAQDQTARLERLIRDQQRQIEALRREVGGIRTQSARRTPAARNAVTKDGVVVKADDEPYVLKGGLPRSWRLPGPISTSGSAAR